MLTSVDDTELIQRFVSSGDALLREEVILRFVPLVHFVLGRLGISRAEWPDYEDAVSQGMLGLIEAVDNFDPSFQTQFSTYATHRVRGRVLDHLRSLDWLSRTARKRTRRIQDAMQELWGRLGRAPTDEELAAHLDLDMQAVQQGLVDANRVIVSLDTISNPDGDPEGSLHDLLEDESQPDPEAVFDEIDLREYLVQAVRSLPEREQTVLALYYYEELTLKEAGAVLGVSESRVCQLHARAILNLRSALQARALAQPGDHNLDGADVHVENLFRSA